MINWKSINKCHVAKSLNIMQRFKSLVIGKKKNSTTGFQTSYINKLPKPASSLINTNHFNNIATHTSPAVKNCVHFIGNQIIFRIPDQKIFSLSLQHPPSMKENTTTTKIVISCFIIFIYFFFVMDFQSFDFST